MLACFKFQTLKTFLLKKQNMSRSRPPPPLTSKDTNIHAPPGISKAPWPESKNLTHNTKQQRVRAVHTVNHARREVVGTASSTTDQPSRRHRRPAAAAAAAADGATASSRPSGRTSWMHQSAVVSSQGPGTGLYSHHSSTSQKSRNKRRDGSSTNGQTKHQMEDTHAREREELIALRLEYSAQGQLVEMLSAKVNKMTTIVETSKLSSREMVSKNVFATIIYYRHNLTILFTFFVDSFFFFFFFFSSF